MIQIMPKDRGHKILPEYIREQLLNEYGKILILNMALSNIMREDGYALDGAEQIIFDFEKILKDL